MGTTTTNRTKKRSSGKEGISRVGCPTDANIWKTSYALPFGYLCRHKTVSAEKGFARSSGNGFISQAQRVRGVDGIPGRRGPGECGFASVDGGRAAGTAFHGFWTSGTIVKFPGIL